MNKQEYKITKTATGQTYNLPIFFEDNGEQLGVMIGFDGNIAQIDETCNFTYSGNSYSLKIYNTVNTNKLSFFVNSVFTIDWGDGNTTELAMTGINDEYVSYATHTYTTSGTKTIIVTLESPWDVKEVKKDVVIPFTNSFGLPTDLGTLTFTIPYTNPPETIEQNYLTDYRTLTGNTEETLIGFQAVGKSRVDEFKLYGSGNQYSGLTIVSGYTGYTIDGLHYIDTPDGTTIITGNTDQYYDEEVYNGMITRNEHFIGFVEEPVIFSDIFVERGKMGVMEKNLRLCEMDNTGEIENYGNGYFNIRKQ